MVRTQGFTLIELLVVIAIIGVLSSVIMTSLNSARLKAQSASRIATVDELKKAFALAIEDNNGKPPISDGSLYCIGTDSCWGGTVNNTTLDASIAKYMRKIPLDSLHPTRIYNSFTYRSPARYSAVDGAGNLYTVTGSAKSYSISWVPVGVYPDDTSPTPQQCAAEGGIFGAWDNAPGSTHCATGGTCRQCGIVVEP